MLEQLSLYPDICGEDVFISRVGGGKRRDRVERGKFFNAYLVICLAGLGLVATHGIITAALTIFHCRAWTL